MNQTKIAQLLRELADAFEEGVPDERPSSSRTKRERRAPMLTRPVGEAQPEVSGQVRKILRERGLT